jgi:putative endonuclease
MGRPFVHARGMGWVYILECGDGTFYVGSTNDLERRVWQHQNGEGAAYTRRRQPVRLAWCQVFDRIDEAWAFEKRLQTWDRRKRIALIEGRVDDLPLLASRSHAALTSKHQDPRSRDGRRATSSTSGPGHPPPPLVEEGHQGPPPPPLVEEGRQGPSRDPATPTQPRTEQRPSVS